MNSKGFVSSGTPVSPFARTLIRYWVPAANSGSARSTISRRLVKVARIFTAGEIPMLAVASEPTRSCGTTSLVNSTRTGEWREMAPSLCWLIEVTHCGSGGAVRCEVATPVLPLQFTHRNTAAVANRAERKLRIMEAPEGEVSTQVQYSGRTCR